MKLFEKDELKMNLDKLIKESSLNKDWEKMAAYFKKESDLERLAKSIGEPEKAARRAKIASLMGWDKCEKAMKNRAYELGMAEEDIDKIGETINNLPDDVKNEVENHKARFKSNFFPPKLTNWIESYFDDYSKKSIRLPDGHRPDGAQARNGRLWPESAEFNLTKDGITVIYDITSYTSEGVDGKYGHYGYVISKPDEYPTLETKHVDKLIDYMKRDFESK